MGAFSQGLKLRLHENTSWVIILTENNTQKTRRPLIMYLDFVTFATIIFVIVDDWLKLYAHYYLSGKVGQKPIFTDSEVLTLMLLQEFMPFHSERRFLNFIKGNYHALFPKLIDQSQFNRRKRSLRLILNELRKELAKSLDTNLATLYVLDTAPVPVVGYKRPKNKSDFWGSAAYGYCVSKKMHYWGYKFVLLATEDGIPVAFELVPANTDERDAAEEVLSEANFGSIVLGDKGFIDSQRQEEWIKDFGVSVYTFRRTNQKVKNTYEIQQLLKEHLRQIETTLSSLKRVEELEHHNAKTLLGLITRVITKVTAYILRHVLLRFHGIDILNFEFLTVA
jgi:hypothetical protein